LINPKTGKKWKVYMGLPSNGSVSDFQNYVLRDLVERYSDEIDLVFPDSLCQRIFHDAAREGIIQDFLATDCDMIWMLDSDICPPKHVLDLVTMHGDKWQVAGAPYPVFMAQPGESVRQLVFTVYKSTKPGPDGSPRLSPCDCPNDGQEFIDGIATGCLFIKREVFDKLERPYFEFKYDPVTRMPILGEDLGFCLKMYKLGIKFFVDYSMSCKHFKNNIDLLEINNYAISYAQKCVNMQASAISEQVTKVEEKYRRIKEENKKMREFITQMKEDYEAVQSGLTKASRAARSPNGLILPSQKPLIFR
jgi:hypothetical protein